MATPNHQSPVNRIIKKHYLFLTEGKMLRKDHNEQIYIFGGGGEGEGIKTIFLK